MDFAAFEAQRIRLRLLEALALQPARPASLSLYLLMRHLQTKGLRKDEDYLRIQLAWLADQANAVRLIDAGDELVAVLQEAGRKHVEGQKLIPGIDPPKDG